MLLNIPPVRLPIGLAQKHLAMLISTFILCGVWPLMGHPMAPHTLPTLITTFTISGNAGTAGAVIHYVDGVDKYVASDTNGNYTMSLPQGWSGRLTPSKVGYTFTPAHQEITNLSANQTLDFAASPIQVVITWNPPAPIVYGTPLSAAQLTADANLPGTYVYTPPLGTVLGAGLGQGLSVTFTPSDSSISPVTQSVTLDVLKAPQTITFTVPPQLILGGAPLTLSAFSSSGLPIHYTHTNPTVVNLSGNTLTPMALGSTILSAHQSGDANYLPATSADRTLQVIPDPSGPQIQLYMLSEQSTTCAPILNVSGNISCINGFKSLAINGSPVKPLADGRFSHALRLNAGSNLIQIKGLDQSNLATTLSRTIIFDELAPFVAILSPSDNSALADEVIAIETQIKAPPADENGEDPIESLTYQLDDQGPVSLPNPGELMNLEIPAHPGIHHLEIVVQSRSGKRGSAKLTFEQQSAFSFFLKDPPRDHITTKGVYTLKGSVEGAQSPVSATLQVGTETPVPLSILNGHFEYPLSLGLNKVYALTLKAQDATHPPLTIQRNLIKVSSMLPSFTTSDAQRVMDLLKGAPITEADLARYDVAPLRAGIPLGDAKIDIEDLIVILHRIAGHGF